jgi:hypothetical protein
VFALSLPLLQNQCGCSTYNGSNRDGQDRLQITRASFRKKAISFNTGANTSIFSHTLAFAIRAVEGFGGFILCQVMALPHFDIGGEIQKDLLF